MTSHRHNDLPWQLRMQFNNQLNTVDLYTLSFTHTNIPKIKEGHLAAQVCEYSCTETLMYLNTQKCHYLFAQIITPQVNKPVVCEASSFTH